MEKLKAGVLGAGHLGKIHLRLLNQSDKYELVGFYDPDEANAQKVSQEFGYHRFDSIEALIAACDMVDVVTPTLNHFACAEKIIKAGKHLFIEKPIATTVEEAEQIIALAEAHQVKGQVGHVERFNPAFTAVRDQIQEPMFIEAHRLAEFNPRGTDVPVVLDLMIHDIDVILSVVKSKVKHISASSAMVISHSPDITNARIEFENGCVANLTASRISMKNMRKSRFFQQEAPEVAGDFDMILQNAEGERKQIYFEYPEIHNNNAILDELESFADAIRNNTTPTVTLQQGTEALRIAKQILNQ